MHRTLLVRTLTAATAACLAVSGLATAASADDPAATVTLGTADVLTLPDADGVRDTTPLSVSSDIATTVSLSVWNSDQSTKIEDLASVDLPGGAVPTAVTIPVTGLPAGDLVVVATPAVGDSTSTALTVGTGEPSNVSLSLSATTIFTYAKATPRTTAATVTATDETGLNVPFVGSVKATVGGKSTTASVSSTNGSAKTATISVSKLALGTGSVVATVHGASLVNHASSPVTLKVAQTAISSVKVAAAYATVFPAKDSYRDSVKITVTPKTAAGNKIAATGSVTITYKGKKVKSWKLTSSKTWSATWNGKKGGKIVPGTYTVTVKLKGAEGKTKTSKTTIKVDSGKLKTKTKTVKYKAHSILKTYVSFDEYDDSYCTYSTYKTGDFGCIGYDAYYDDTLSVIGDGSATLPSYVVSAQKYAAPTATVTLHTTYLDGSAAWSIDTSEYGAAKVGAITMGNKSLSSLKLPSGSKKLYVTVGLGEYSLWVADTITVKYSYKVMTH